MEKAQKRFRPVEPGASLLGAGQADCADRERSRGVKPWAAAVGFTLVVALGSGVSANAQEPIWTGQLRPRFEVRDPSPPGSETAAFTSLRTRVAMSTQLSPRVSVFIQAQDVRFWGEEENTLSDFSADALDLHQGWIEFHARADGPLVFRVGRQEAVYGEQRLVGAVDWTPQGRAFDGVRARWDEEPIAVDFFAFQVSEASSGPDRVDATFLGGHLAWRGDAGRTAEGYLFHLRDGVPGAETRESTVGARYLGRSGRLGYRMEGALQRGRRDSEDVRAWFGSVRASVFVADDRGAVVAAFDRLSGDSDPNDGTVRVFSTLFATNHAFYGQADLFLSIPRDTGGRGLDDLSVGGRWSFDGDVAGRFDLHRFRATAGGGRTLLADELDLAASGPVAEGLRWSAGASLVEPGPALEAFGRSAERQWFGFFQLDARF